MLLYFNRAPFMLAHCPIDDICLPVFENIYILIIVLLCLSKHIFIGSFTKYTHFDTIFRVNNQNMQT